MYLDDLSELDWKKLGDAYSQDAMRFFGEEKVFDRPAQQEAIARIKQLGIPMSGMPFEKVRESLVHDILPGSIHQHSKSYLAFPDKGSSLSAQYASLVCSATNQNLIAEDKSAPTGTFLETAIIHWMRKLVGYIDEDSPYPTSALELGGAFVTGGVLANTIGLLGARQARFPESKAKGMASLGVSPKVIVPGETMSHYSHFGSSWWLGIGTENVIEAPCNAAGRIDQAMLEKTLVQLEREGTPVIAVIAVMGDSRSNTLEDLPGLYAITQKHNVWLHVDACHGGILMFDQTFTHENRHVLSYSDSLSFDPHKHLGIPYSNSVILFSNAKHLADIGSSTDITICYNSSDIGQVTPFLGSRPFDALKLYALLLELGVDGIAASIDKRKKLAKQWAELINSSEHFVTLHDPELFAVSFSIRPVNGESPNEISRKNLILHDALHKEGNLVLHKFSIRDYRNRLGFGSSVNSVGLGSYIGDNYSNEELNNLLAELERKYRELFTQ